MTFSSEIATLSRRSMFQWLALIILFTISTRFEPLSSAVVDPDLWWHLRGGESIVTEHVFPHNGIFTRHTERPWVEYSWAFEVLAFYSYHWFGLMGLVVLRSFLEVVITATLFILLRGGLGNFWQAWVLTLSGMWAIHHCLGTQPMLTSVTMFTIELLLIFEARRKRTVGPLFVLPFLFLLWANFHIQFAYGILMLVLLAIASMLTVILPVTIAERLRSERELPAAPVVAATVLSFLATLIGPYGIRLYQVLANYVHSSVPYAIITELQALNFRVPEHYVLLMIIAAAFFVLGWRRSFDVFELALLLVCTLIGFRMTRDSWLACLPALAIIADRRSFTRDQPSGTLLKKFAFAASVVAGSALVFALVAWDSQTNNSSLNLAVSKYFPKRACDFIAQQSLQGPIYNDMNWGGFIIWNLPDKPVSIDNRTDLYGDEILSRSFAVQQGVIDWKLDPDLNSAQILLLNRHTPLGSVLAHDPHFRLVYEDPLAIVLTHEVSSSAALSSRSSGQ
jgi:hypothetical protein